MRVCAERTVVLLAVAMAALSACGPAGEPRQVQAGTTLELPAAGGGSVSLELPTSESTAVDSMTGPADIPTAIVTLTPNERARIRAVVIPEAGTDASTRVAYLREAGLDSVDVLGDGDVPLVAYYTGDSASLERVWPCGSNQLLALRATMAGDSRGILLRYLGDAFAGATRQPWDDLRSVYLADRTRPQIFEEAGEEDVTPPPHVHHSLGLRVRPTTHRLDLTDTLTVDFSRTPSDSQLVMNPPEWSGGSVSALTPLRGQVRQSGGRMVCRADSQRVFRGVYSGSLEGFFVREEGSDYALEGRIKLNLSFCCGAWLHPWSADPADYTLRISAPPGYSIYAPLEEVDRTESDTLQTVTLTTPEGGIRGPVAWAVGYLGRRELRSGSSVVLPEPDSTVVSQVSDSATVQSSDTVAAMRTLAAVDWADNLGRFCWGNLGFEGARLDYVLISGDGSQVLRAGPGCLFVSPGLLVSLGDYPSWPDSLRRGIRPRGADVVGAASAAILSRSTHLDPALEKALCAWSVLRYYEENLPSRAEGGSLMRQAFLRYYLHQSEDLGGTEYALADPRLLGSDLEDAVLLGKAPLVLDMLDRSLQRFALGLRRSLASLRHSGNSFLRLHSASRIPAGTEEDELFWKWLTYPGIPQVTVTWQDSAGVLYLDAAQWQPGLEFPLRMDSVRVSFTDGSSASLHLSRRQGGQMYVAVLPDTAQRVLSVRLNSDCRMPADFLYRRSEAR